MAIGIRTLTETTARELSQRSGRDRCAPVTITVYSGVYPHGGGSPDEVTRPPRNDFGRPSRLTP